MSENRQFYGELANGVKIFKVRLVNGPAHGGVALCSGKIVWQGGAKYVRGEDDLYYYEPEAGGKN